MTTFDRPRIRGIFTDVNLEIGDDLTDALEEGVQDLADKEDVEALGDDMRRTSVAFEGRINDKLAAFEGRMNDKFAAFEGRMNDKLGALEARMTDKLAALEAQMNDKLAALEARMRADMAALEARQARTTLALAALFITTHGISTGIIIAVLG